MFASWYERRCEVGVLLRPAEDRRVLVGMRGDGTDRVSPALQDDPAVAQCQLLGLRSRDGREADAPAGIHAEGLEDEGARVALEERRVPLRRGLDLHQDVLGRESPARRVPAKAGEHKLPESLPQTFLAVHVPARRLFQEPSAERTICDPLQENLADLGATRSARFASQAQQGVEVDGRPFLEKFQLRSTQIHLEGMTKKVEAVHVLDLDRHDPNREPDVALYFADQLLGRRIWKRLE
mmetsp:Transcript_76375/g.202819  ORF Transcript_76375/g.202819 Transcript_76375/m.202819 type:complete len:238 (-) Transcript_76375:344-1057(-)